MKSQISLCVVSLLALVAGCREVAQRGHTTKAEFKWSIDSLMNSNHTPTWEDAVEMAEALALSDDRAHLIQIGWSDIGRPIHALVLTESGIPALEKGCAAEDAIGALAAWSAGRPKMKRWLWSTTRFIPGTLRGECFAGPCIPMAAEAHRGKSPTFKKLVGLCPAIQCGRGVAEKLLHEGQSRRTRGIWLQRECIQP